MKISKQYRDKIKQEFDFVIQQMAESDTPDKMLYYFSGVSGVLNKVLNFEYSDELLFAYFVTERTCKDITNQLNAMRQGSPFSLFHEDFGSKLIKITQDLGNNFFDSKLRLEHLNKLVVLGYTCTGNGYYLSKKNEIKIFEDAKQLKAKE